MIALKLVAPSQDQLRANILNVCGLEIVKFHSAVRTVIDSKGVVRCQLNLLELQIDRLVYPIDKLIDASIDCGQNGRLLINLEL